MAGAPDAAQAWCREWWPATQWENPARVQRMLDALVAHGLHAMRAPTFNYYMRAGLYHDWCIRMAWQDEKAAAHRRRINVWIHDRDDGVGVEWSVDWVRLFPRGPDEHPYASSDRTRTLHDAQAQVGLDIVSLYGDPQV